MSRAVYHIGDVLAVLPTLPAGSVDLVICSPPFLALRSYLPADHPDKALEHGSEATPAAFLANLLDVTELLGRVLAPHGSIAIELGDTFSGTGGSEPTGVEYDTPSRNETNGRRSRRQDEALGILSPRKRPGPKDRDRVTLDRGWPLPKSLCFVPSLYGASLAYGRNLLALPGSAEWREFAPWRVRNLVAWVRPNPPVGALGDKWRPATSYITVATRSATRYWDDIPTRRPHNEAYAQRRLTPRREQRGGVPDRPRVTDGVRDTPQVDSNSAGAPLLDWWEITPTGFTSRLGQHYATFPPAIVEPLVEACCPRRVCRTCGTPSRRLTERGELEATPSARIKAWDRGKVHGVDPEVGGMAAALKAGGFIPNHQRPATTVGWSTCGCPGTEHTRDDGFHDGDGWRPGLVLDPYAGTGTTLLVATGHGRDAIGIDLDERNAALAEERIGMFLTIKESAA